MLTYLMVSPMAARTILCSIVLSDSADVVALNAERRWTLRQRAALNKVGKREAKMSFSMGYMCNMMCAMVCGPKRKPRAYSLNMTKFPRQN